jgi:predicted alpha/beta-fold hydrolase
MDKDFKAAWWLRSPHNQTLWPTFFRNPDKMNEHWESVELPDGDFLDLVWNKDDVNQSEKPIVVLLHGLGGGIASTYSKGLMKSISHSGLRPVLMHFRGASGVPNRLPRGYHSGETEDLSYIINFLKNRSEGRIGCVGISIGANMLIKWLGETGTKNPLKVAVAVSTPFELASVANRLMQGFSRVYQWWLLRKLIQDKKTKFSRMASPVDLSGLDRVTNFWEYDEMVTAPMFGFMDVHDYYRKSSCRQFLPRIVVPTLIIHAKDDPFMTPDVIPNKNELSKTTRLEVSLNGGHVGFIGGNIPGKAMYWLEYRIPLFLKNLFR